MMCSVSRCSLLGRMDQRASRPSVHIPKPGLGAALVEISGWASDLQLRPQDPCSRQAARGSICRMREGMTIMSPRWKRSTQMPLWPPHHQKAPAGQKSVLLTETTVPTADLLLIQIHCQSLSPKGKTNYLLREKMLLVSWTMAHNHMLISETAVN